MTTLAQLLAKKKKQNAAAKASSISGALSIGIEEYLVGWLTDFQQDYAKCRNDLERQMMMKSRADGAYGIIRQIDPDCNITLKWYDRSNDSETLSNLGVDGICVHWSPIGQNSQGKDQLLVDSSLLLMREFGVE